MALCHHGYEQDKCLICEVLGTTTVEPGRPVGRDGRLGGRHVPAPAPGTPTVPAPRRHRPLATVALVAVVVLAALLAAWVLAGAFFAILRIVEIVAVGFAAGWVGYRVGHWRGQHERWRS